MQKHSFRSICITTSRIHRIHTSLSMSIQFQISSYPYRQTLYSTYFSTFTPFDFFFLSIHIHLFTRFSYFLISLIIFKRHSLKKKTEKSDIYHFCVMIRFYWMKNWRSSAQLRHESNLSRHYPHQTVDLMQVWPESMIIRAWFSPCQFYWHLLPYIVDEKRSRIL